MKKIFYIFGFCCLLTLGFTACQQEEDALEQLSLEELQKRGSKKHPKLEYTTTVKNNSADSPPTMKCIYDDKNNALQISIQKDTNEQYYISFKNSSGVSIYQEMQASIDKGKIIIINVFEIFPCSFEIDSDTFNIKGEVFFE